MAAIDGISDRHVMEFAAMERVKKKPNIKRFLIAAVIAAVIATVAFSVGASDLSERTDAIVNSLIFKINEMSVGEKMELDGITIFRTSDSPDFPTIEEFFEKTGYDVLYPSKLPENVEIIEVSLFDSRDENGNYTPEYQNVAYATSDPENYSIVVSMNPNESKKFLTAEGHEVKEINGFECYFPMDYGECRFIHNGYVYYVKAPTDSEIEEIISGLREYED